MIRVVMFSVVYLLCFNVFGQNSVNNEDVMDSIDRGVIIYEDFCMNCHLVDGEGVENVIPPLALSDFLMKNREESLKVVKFGQSGKIVVNGKTYNGTMTAMGLTGQEIADVMNYITNSFGNSNAIKFTEQEVLKIEK
ncbi:c-type cytochrome [Aureibaculum algae]|uniref:c-type cytochrome n=1 Tax=Aureibaculum algae TaxID=2584122 RepID=UPI002029D036|nr:cytochrome c [Aureibaculum algae]